uniref:Uncharacterized protein n=1 Tax=Anguilla anguilla TaxID=7936 RepID=A0A0E9V8X2_ANGAN
MMEGKRHQNTENQNRKTGMSCGFGIA